MRRPTDRLAEHLASALEREASLAEVLETLAAEGGAPSYRKAAAELRAGRAAEQALVGLEALGPAYRAPLAANEPGALREVARADRLLRHYRTRMSNAAVGALGTLTLVLGAVALAVNAALPALARWGHQLAPDAPGQWRASAAILELLFHPISLGVLAALLVTAAVLAARARWRGPSFRLYGQAAACRTLHALLEVGLPLDRALELATEITGNRRLVRAGGRAAKLARDGRPAGDVLAAAELVPPALLPLWGLAEQPSAEESEDRLVEVSAGLARAVEVEAEALLPTVGRGLWHLYTVVAGALVLWLAVTMVLAWREVIQWPG